jgi:Zn-dependent membrane protease YugP/DNA-binding transcriptional MerR regulator
MRKETLNITNLYRIGELSQLSGISPRTIDYYTGLGLLIPTKRSTGNYRLYDHETLTRIRRIELLKVQKFSLEEIREQFSSLSGVTTVEAVSRKLSELQTHLSQLEREVKELEPVLDQLKPQQVKRLFRTISPQTAACIDALLLFMGKSNFMWFQQAAINTTIGGNERMLFFHPMDFLIIIAFILSIWAQFRVKSTFNRWSQVQSSSGMTGFEAARRMLDRNGLQDIPIEPVAGSLSDHYDPLQRVVRLSETVYYKSSISALSVACHEVGHAIQHQNSYPMLVARHRMFPVVRFASGAAPLLLIAGILFSMSNLVLIGIIFFTAAVAFQLVTLPVEFNASSRARDLMISEGFITQEEERGVAKVLNAAALTYVAAALIALLQLLKFIMIFMSNRN